MEESRDEPRGARPRRDEPRWLTAHELEAWVQMAMLLTHLPGELDGQLLRDSDMTHFEYEVLSVLSDTAGERMRLSELAVLAGGSLSRLSHVVKKLEKRGWVDRVPSADDKRVTYAELTREGYAAVVRAAPGYVDNVRSLVIDRLSSEQLEQFTAIGHALNAHVQRLT